MDRFRPMNGKIGFLFCFILSFLPASGVTAAQQRKKPETSHLVFVTEYVRELAAIEDISVLLVSRN